MCVDYAHGVYLQLCMYVCMCTVCNVCFLCMNSCKRIEDMRKLINVLYVLCERIFVCELYAMYVYVSL